MCLTSFQYYFSHLLNSQQVSLDSSTREIVNNNMVDPTIHAFDEAQKQIYILMLRDSFPRFLNSKMFRNLMENASRKEPWLKTSLSSWKRRMRPRVGGGTDRGWLVLLIRDFYVCVRDNL